MQENASEIYMDIFFRESVSLNELDLAHFIFDNTPPTKTKRKSIFKPLLPLDEEELLVQGLIKPSIETQNFASMATLSQWIQRSYCFDTVPTNKYGQN